MVADIGFEGLVDVLHIKALQRWLRGFKMQAEMPLRGFTTSEFQIRISRAQELMVPNGFDALLFTTPHNIRWATGFDTQFWESPTRPWFLVIPAKGTPIAVIPEIAGSRMAETWIDDVRTWPSPRPDDDGTSVLASVLDTLPRRYGRIGMELG